MATSKGQNSAQRRASQARIRRVEQSQRQFEKRMEAMELEINQLLDRRDKDARLFIRQVHGVVQMFQQLTEQVITIYELQEKSELRQDRFTDRQEQLDGQLAKLTEQVGKLAIEQAETTRKLKALIDLDRRRRANGQNGKKSRD